MQKVARSVPDAFGSVVRQGLSPLFFHLFGVVVQVEVNQNCVDLGVWMLLQDLAPNHLDAPYAGTAQLAFPRRARGNRFLGLDVRLELGRKPEAVQSG